MTTIGASKQLTRLTALETKAGVHRRAGGVVVTGQPADAAEWERMVADAQAKAGPGAHLIVPGMALDVDEWERRVIVSQKRIARGIFD